MWLSPPRMTTLTILRLSMDRGFSLTGKLAPPNPGFLQLRTSAGGYNPATEVQEGTPFEVQIGIRCLH